MKYLSYKDLNNLQNSCKGAFTYNSCHSPLDRLYSANYSWLGITKIFVPEIIIAINQKENNTYGSCTRCINCFRRTLSPIIELCEYCEISDEDNICERDLKLMYKFKLLY